MYKKTKPPKSEFTINTSYTGERLEQKIRRIVHNKEPITDGAPLIYTKRTDGVLPDYDIRTDRFEAAIIAMDKVQRNNIARRDNFHKPKISEAEPIQGTKGEASI